MKQVYCTHCNQPSEVSEKAMSVFCPHCTKRLILEDFRIRSYTAVRDFATCGDVVVEKRGMISARLLVGNLLVKGTVQGEIEVRDKLEVSKTGDVRGDIRAPRLVVRTGAKIRGYCRIGPAR